MQIVMRTEDAAGYSSVGDLGSEVAEFNPDKCEVTHFGRSNTDGKYTVNGKTLHSIDRQRDLGVQVPRSRRWRM